MVFDTILRGGTVIDGSGKAGFRADVGMLDGKIAAVGNLTDARARRILDVTERLVTPGLSTFTGTRMRQFSVPGLETPSCVKA